MSKQERKAKNVARHVLKLYRDLEPAVRQQVAKVTADFGGPVQCKEGCAHCCRLMVITGVPEMIPVAEYLSQRADWAKRKPELVRKVTEYLRILTEIGINEDPDSPERLEFWMRQVSCPFLVNERCSVYPVRPSACRYHVVVTDPGLCAKAVDNPIQEIASIDLRPVENEIGAQAAMAYGEITGGSIAACFVLACRALGVDFPVPDELVQKGLNFRALLVED